MLNNLVNFKLCWFIIQQKQALPRRRRDTKLQRPSSKSHCLIWLPSATPHCSEKRIWRQICSLRRFGRTGLILRLDVCFILCSVIGWRVIGGEPSFLFHFAIVIPKDLIWDKMVMDSPLI